MLTWLAHRLDGDLAADEVVDLYPAVAWRAGKHWKVRVRGCVYEPSSVPGVARLMRRWLGVDPDGLDPAARELVTRRLAPFLVDKERGKRFHLHLGPHERVLGMTQANGHFDGTFRFTEAEWTQASLPTSHSAAVPVRLRTRRVGRDLSMPMQVIAGGGWSVVADIDDTVKLTDVLNRRETVLNTFARPFRAVDGIADAFAEWNRKFDPDWHYVSGGPWQLWSALEQFRSEAGLPVGSWHMQEFRAKDRSALRFLGPPVKHKLAEIRQLIRMDPARRFILVGDSGQGDPEIYGRIATEFPARIAWVWIRELGTEGADSPRYEKAFGGGCVGGWGVFHSGADLVDWASHPRSGGAGFPAAGP
jgi:phosphatidate phosphatase APP1